MNGGNAMRGVTINLLAGPIQCALIALVTLELATGAAVRAQDLPDLSTFGVLDSSSPEGVVSGGTGIGTTSLLVSTTECFQFGCSEIDAILRYNGSTGAYIGVHIPSISDPWAMAIHPIRESLLIVSRADATVREYDAQTGAFVRVLVSPGAEGLHLPQGIALSSTGRLFVASNQTSGQLTKFNGILEFNSTTGAFISNFVDGGSSLSETCSNPICLRGPNAMTITPNGKLFVISAINDSVQEFNLSGVFQGAFTSAKLIGPSGLAVRPQGTTNAGNLLVSSRYINPSSDFDDTIVEFNGLTRALVTTNGGVFAGVPGSMIRPGPLAWHTDGHLLVAERAGEIPPGYADKVGKRNGATGVNLGQFSAAGDTHAHQITAILHTHVNYATDDSDADSDTDLKDLAAFQNCFPSSTTAACLTPFDDNKTASIGRWDFLAFIGNMHGPRRPCTNASQCNDNDVCSVDSCVGGFCSYASAADGTACADSLFCDGSEACRSGVCRGITPCKSEAHCNESTDTCRTCLVNSECNDDNPCTDDTCTASFTCQFTAHTRTCNDGNVCTTNDRCNAGACVGGAPPNCNDNNVCTTDACDTVLGCIHTDNLLSCDDGSACSLQDFCLQGTCRPGRNRDCDDDNICTNDGCNAATGCTHTNNTGTCDDEDPCTDADTCAVGICRGTPKNCADTVACTVDRCIGGVCENQADNSRCSNGNWCDGTETCNATLGCQPGTPPCNDNISCTTNNCNPSEQSCSYTPNHAICSNGLFCDGIEQCSLTNGCQAGAPPNCNDNVACTTDACNEQADNCSHTPDDEVCDDDDVCTDDFCEAGGCEYDFNTAPCDDGLLCTIEDTCGDGDCSGTPVTCPVGEQCDPADGQCKACLNNGNCNDNNACTTDTCNAGTCVFTPNSLPCNDGFFCTLTDVCAGGVCNGSGNTCSGQFCNETTDACVQCLSAANCEDNNICTDNVCTAAGVCQFPANSVPCPDGFFCNGNEVCGGGSCLPGTAPNCSDGIPCTTDSCNENTDGCDHTPLNSACNDNQFCNGIETCHATLGCQAGTSPNCSDGLACTVDSCNEGTDSCDHTPNNGACADGLFCNGNETCHGTNGCTAGIPVNCSSLDDQCLDGVCNESTDACIAVPVANGLTCDDGMFCTSNDSCEAGECEGDPTCTGPCDENGNECVECFTVADCVNDTNPCTNLACVSGSCQFTNNTNVCDDGLFCTVSDQCASGACVGAPRSCTSAPNLFCDETLNSCVECLANADCNDDNFCTNDVCTNGVCFNFVHGEPCDDGLFCTINDHCLGGTCLGNENECGGLLCDEAGNQCVECLAAGDCADDSDPCTDRACVNGLCEFNDNTANCDDGLACTENDQCFQGLCGGDPLTCDDGIGCTIDSCEEPGGCVHTPDNFACEDGLSCTGDETCEPGIGCVSTGDPCAPIEYCNEVLDRCEECLLDQHCADDGLFCNGQEICENNLCTHSGDPCVEPQSCDESTNSCLEP